jgi:hypothetical protein
MNNFSVSFSNKCILDVLTNFFFGKDNKISTILQDMMSKVNEISERSEILKTISSHDEFELCVSRYMHVDHARATHQQLPNEGVSVHILPII